MESPYETFEIRWFSADPLPVNREFVCEDPSEIRTDFYLVPSHRDCGVKYRDELLETKLRVGPIHRVTINSVSGNSALWRKWSTGWGNSTRTPSEDIWEAVEKSRWLHRFGWIAESAVGPVPESSKPCAYLEYGIVSVKSRRWETVCIECTGGSVEEMSRLMVATIEHLEETGWIVGKLPSNLSRSYPELLSSAQFAV